jgi:hypothetical protein
VSIPGSGKVTTNSSNPTSKIIDILGAVASGLTVGYFAAWVRDSEGMPSSEYAAFIFLATCSYLVVALLTPQTNRGIIRRIPLWAFVALLGALLTFLTINFIGDVRHMINFQVRSATTFASAVEAEAERLTANVLVFSLISLPIMCMIHYLGHLLAKFARKD